MMENNRNIEKLTEPFFPGKFIPAQIWEKGAQNGPKIGFSGLLKTVSLFFPVNDLK